MEDKMNILVIGNSGSGKSTLIETVTGTVKNTRPGEGDTAAIEVTESSIWPIRCIDTKGFEYNLLKQAKTIYQVNRFTKEQVKERDSESGIDAVWYCIDGVGKRVFTHNIGLMNRAMKGWNNIPVFAVITKSYSETEEKENIDAVAAAFARNGRVNLQKIIPVVAKAFPIRDDVIVEPKGVDELCALTIACSDYAKQINNENLDRMVLEQKRFAANGLVTASTAAAAVIGAVPLGSITDATLLVPLEVGMTKGLFKIYEIRFSSDLITSIVGSTVITNVAKATLAKIKDIPSLTAKIAGGVINAVVAGVFVAVLGESMIALSEASYKGKIDVERIDDAVGFITEKMKSNQLVGRAVTYLENNADKLKDKKPKDIIEDIFKADKK